MPKSVLKPKGKRRIPSKQVSDLEKQTLELVAQIARLKIAAEQIEDLKKRVDDLEYFRDHAKELLDIQDIQDS